MAPMTQVDHPAIRAERDATLAMPRPMLPSVQIDMRVGALPPSAPNGTRYLKIAIDVLW